jgi:hypothetical protein
MKDACLKLALKFLSGLNGVNSLKLLTEDEKKIILSIEEKEEENIVYGMCKSFNKSVREALERTFTVALIIDTSRFEYPHHPKIVMVCGETIIGEYVHEIHKIEELRKDKTNFFLWDGFVVYTSRLPKDRKARENLRMIYMPVFLSTFDKAPCMIEIVIGTPSIEGDTLIKNLLSFSHSSPFTGTCLIGFNVKN